MDFDFRMKHPAGTIKVSITGGTPQSAVATIQMGHEIVSLLGGEVTDAVVPIEQPKPAAKEMPRGSTAEESRTEHIDAETDCQPGTDLGTYEIKDGGLVPVEEPEADEPEEVAEVDSAGTPFNADLHTGTLKKDGTWRLKRGAADTLAEDVPETAPQPEAKVEPAADEAEITDAELQRYCGRLAAHFGGSDSVFAIAAKHVPEGEMPRPTAIKDQAARRAFIKQAEEETGVVYHG
jgi:hypothetical protein